MASTTSTALREKESVENKGGVREGAVKGATKRPKTYPKTFAATRAPAKRFTIDDFAVGKKIGQGKYGHVFRCKPVGAKKICVLKVVNKKEILEDGVLHQLKREVEVHSRCRHENIVRFYCYFQDKERVFMVLEYCDGGSVYDLLQASPEGRFEEPFARHVFVQTLGALEYLRRGKSVPIIHRDIKPENLLFQCNGKPVEEATVKLADFGWAVQHVASSVRQTLCGTPDYLPPEVVEGSRYAGAFDLWTLGVLLFEMITGHPPFANPPPKEAGGGGGEGGGGGGGVGGEGGEEEEEVGDDLSAKTMERIAAGDYSIPAFVSEPAADLIRQLLQRDPEKRPSLESIKAHPWVKGEAGGGE